MVLPHELTEDQIHSVNLALSRPIIYIAGPYSEPSPIRNVRRAVLIAHEIKLIRGVPIVPHLYHFWDYIIPQDYDYWINATLPLVRSADALYRFPGVSPGAALEVKLAQMLGRPVFYDLRSLEEWIPRWVNVLGPGATHGQQQDQNQLHVTGPSLESVRRALAKYPELDPPQE